MNHRFTFITGLGLIVFIFFSMPGMGQGRLDTKRTPWGGYEYTAYLPDGYDEGLNAPYPVLVYLHGGNGVKMVDDIATFDDFKYGIPLLIANNFRGRYPSQAGYKWTRADFIVIVPHLPWPCPLASSEPCTENDALWDVSTLDETISDVETHYASNIDLNRIYFTGISLGAKGVWDYAMAHHEVPAAIVPISGNAFPDDLCNLKDMPVWAFHGDADGQVAPDEKNEQERSGTYLLIDALNDCFDNKYYARLTKMMFKGHDFDGGAWDPIYDQSSGYDIYDWMLRHVKGDNSNIAPFVHFNQPDQKYKWEGESMIVKLQVETFDTDGDALTVSWDLIEGNEANVEFLAPEESPQGDSARYVRFNAPGEYVLQVEVSDGTETNRSETNRLLAATVTKQLSLTFVENPAAEIAVTGFELYDGNTRIGTLQNRDKIEMSDLGSGKVTIKAIINDPVNIQSVRFSLDDNSNFKTVKKGQNNGTYFLSNWTPTPGEYIVTATPYEEHTPPVTSGISSNFVIYVDEDPVVLPVEFLSVAAKRTSGKVIVSWATATEDGNDFFTIERAAGTSQPFQAIGTGEGAGDSKDIKHYSFIDYSPLKTSAFYRVKQTDFDGKSTYSKITSVEGTSQFEVSLFPNPSERGNTYLQLSTPDVYSEINLQVVDAMGNTSFKGTYAPEVFLKSEEFGLNLPFSLSAGLYFLIISQGEQKIQQKFVIK